jgi:hypothetical protein
VFSNRLVKLLVLFSVVSMVLGIAATMSPAICAMGWVWGTALSTVAGIFYGRRAEGRLAAFGGGAVIGGLSIALGTLLAYTLGSIPIQGVIAATLVGIATGAIGGLVARLVARSPASGSPARDS